MRVLVLGAGKMVEAILTGLKTSMDMSEWMIYSPSGKSAAQVASLVGCRAVTDLKMIPAPDWVIVGCKPQQIDSLKETIGDLFKDNLFISILAALSEEVQMKKLGVSKLIRLMPNLPVEFNDGVCLISSNSASDRLDSFKQLFERLGDAVVVSEEELEELTLLTGSGPAFFYEFTALLAESFTSLDQASRERLARHVLSGAAITAGQKNRPLNELINDVTSKAGVTIRVLEKMREANMGKLITESIDAGKTRSKEIRENLQS